MGLRPRRRHFVIPDTQLRAGVPTDHIEWLGRAVLDYRPDVVICLGDWWDMSALNSHAQPGSAEMEGRRYKDDVAVGNAAFSLLDSIVKSARGYSPRKIFLLGNHEHRADREAENSPKFLGHIGSADCDTLDWERHPFLEIVSVDRVLYSHYFQNSHSGRPIGGSIPNKLSRIGESFVHGHVQGLDMGTKIMASGRTLWGIQAGSCYLHRESYRGNQGQRHWNGCLVLNEVADGEHCPMPISTDYLARKFAGRGLYDYMVREYPYQDWSHLACPADLNPNHSQKESGRKSRGAVKKTVGNGRPPKHQAAPAKSMSKAIVSKRRTA